MFRFIAVLVLFSFYFHSSAQRVKVRLANEKDTTVTKLPEFVYGNAELDSFIVDNLFNPPTAEMNGINGNLSLTFTVDTLSQVKDIKILSENFELPGNFAFKAGKGINDLEGLFTGEAERIAEFMNYLWVPGERNDKKDNVKIYMELFFETALYDKWERERIQRGSRDRHRISLHNDQAIIQNKKSPEWMYELGVKKMKEKKYILSIKYFETELLYRPNDKDAIYNMGVCQLRIKDFQNGCKTLRRGMALGDSGAENLWKRYCNQ